MFYWHVRCVLLFWLLLLLLLPLPQWQPKGICT
jgi:hypothetical protein